MAKKAKKKNLKKKDLPEVKVKDFKNGNLEIEGLEEYGKTLKDHGFRPGSIPIFIGNECFDSKDLIEELFPNGYKSGTQVPPPKKPKKKK